MASAATIQTKAESADRSALDRLADDFFKHAEEQLATMEPARRESAVASIHARAEGLRLAVCEPETRRTQAEETLCDAFFELLEDMPPESRHGLLSDLRANAELHGE